MQILSSLWKTEFHYGDAFNFFSEQKSNLISDSIMNFINSQLLQERFRFPSGFKRKKKTHFINKVSAMKLITRTRGWSSPDSLVINSPPAAKGPGPRVGPRAGWRCHQHPPVQPANPHRQRNPRAACLSQIRPFPVNRNPFLKTTGATMKGTMGPRGRGNL